MHVIKCMYTSISVCVLDVVLIKWEQGVVGTCVVCVARSQIQFVSSEREIQNIVWRWMYHSLILIVSDRLIVQTRQKEEIRQRWRRLWKAPREGKQQRWWSFRGIEWGSCFPEPRGDPNNSSRDYNKQILRCPSEGVAGLRRTTSVQTEL